MNLLIMNKRLYGEEAAFLRLCNQLNILMRSSLYCLLGFSSG